MIDKPEMPEPEKLPPGEETPPVQDPSLNGNGGAVPHAENPPLPQQQVDMAKLVDWMKHTDKQLVMLTIGQVGLAAAVLFLIWKAKGEVVKVATP